MKPGREHGDTGTEKFLKGVIGRNKTVEEEVMNEGTVAQDLERLPEPETRREEFHHLPIALLLLHPHFSKTLDEPPAGVCSPAAEIFKERLAETAGMRRRRRRGTPSRDR